MNIYAWSIIWNFFDLLRLQRPPWKKLAYTSEILDFWWCIQHKNDLYWLFWCQWLSDHQDQEFVWGNWHLEAVEASEIAEASEVNETKEVSKAWKTTTEDFRVFQVLKFNILKTKSFYFVVLKKKLFRQNHEKSCWILAPFLLEAVEAVWGQKSFKWWIRHKCPLPRKPLSIIFW